MSMAPVSQALGECPSCCAVNEETGQGQPCGMVGTKLSKFSEGRCVIGCTGPRCRGKRVQRKGRKAHARAQREFGSMKPFTHAHEELDGAYEIPIRFEAKAGRQIPAYFLRFIRSDWFRRALSQAERATPVGEESYASVYMEPHREGAWLVVKIR